MTKTIDDIKDQISWIRKIAKEITSDNIEQSKTKLLNACDVIQGLKKSANDQTKQFIFPVDARITSPYGMRMHPIRKKMIMHNGIDFGASQGADIKAIADGTVEHVGDINDGYGVKVIINHFGSFQSWSCHCLKALAKEGDKVKQGQVVAEVGSTGDSTGPHLHFGLKKDGKWVDPISYLQK